MERVKVYKKIIIYLIILFILLLLSGLAYNQFHNKLQIKEIEAVVQYIGDDYIIVVDDNSDEYYIPDIVDYQVGDKIAFSIKNIDYNNRPFTGEIEEFSTLSKTVNFSIIDDNIDTSTNVENNTNTSDINSNTIVDTTTSVDKNISSNNSSNDIEDTSYGADNTVITYFSNLDNSLDYYSSTSSLGNYLKNGFVTIIDFLFYNKDIKGYTFSDLSTSAKLKVLKLALSIDSKVEDHFPGYKEEISEKTEKIYTNIKSKIVEKYLDITTEVCKNNEDTCATAREDFSNMKKSFSLTWKFIKEISGVGLSRLSSWYEIWRET